tara:strand:+ start:9497 stop:9775 length:279 start_codon:yes stop_codon:yes gene_type:complete
MIDLNKITKNFLMKEWKENPTLSGYIQSVHELLSSLRPKTLKEQNRVSVARQQIKEIKKLTKKLEERVRILEEQIQVLEEGNNTKNEEKTSN